MCLNIQIRTKNYPAYRDFILKFIFHLYEGKGNSSSALTENYMNCIAIYGTNKKIKTAITHNNGQNLKTTFFLDKEEFYCRRSFSIPR